MKIGTSGHPLNTVAYNANGSTIPGVSLEDQVSMLKELGMQVYRIDVKVNADGKLTNSVSEGKFLKLKGLLEEADIQLLPMVYDRIDYSKSAGENEQIGFAQGKGFAISYPGITHIEIGNEIELFDKLKTGAGTKESEYDLPRLEKALHWAKGMHEGIKYVSPDIKTMFGSAGYFPTYMLDRAFDLAGFDIQVWHIYSEMPGAYRSNYGIDNILDYATDRYRKPIWITETNARAKEDLSQGENELRQLEWLEAFRQQCEENGNVEALVLHELLDMPDAPKSFEERNFGIVKFIGDYQNRQYKLLGLELQRAAEQPDTPQEPEPAEQSYKITGLSIGSEGIVIKMKKV